MANIFYYTEIETKLRPSDKALCVLWIKVMDWSLGVASWTEVLEWILGVQPWTQSEKKLELLQQVVTDEDL